MKEHLRRFAAGFGVTGFVAPDRLQNTRKVLAIAEFAREHGKLDAFRITAMNAHWREGKNLEDPVDLAAIAHSAGLDPEAAVAAGSDPEYLERIDAVREEAHELGVNGIPTFLFGDVAVVGCQPYEVLAEAARDAGGRPRRT